jgi:hypothetical protein
MTTWQKEKLSNRMRNSCAKTRKSYIKNEIKILSGNNTTMPEMVNIRYFISENKITYEDAIEKHIKYVSGVPSIGEHIYYYEYTNMMGVDYRSLKIGGHDLYAELLGNVGKYLILCVSI